jgi:membrane protease YdiL (CAAX protease family)
MNDGHDRAATDSQPLLPDAPMSLVPAPPQSPVPGVHVVPAAGGRRWWLGPLVLALVATAFVLQRPPGDDPKRRENIRTGVEVPPPAVETSGVFTKLTLALRGAGGETGGMLVSMLDEQAIESKQPADRFRAAVLGADLFWTEGKPMLDGSAENPVAGPLGAGGPRVSVATALDQIEIGLDAASPLHEDIAAVRSALAGNPPALDSDAAKGLIKRHGRTLGTIAATLKDPALGEHTGEAAEVRSGAAARGWGLIVFLLGFGALFLGGALLGLVLLIMVIATRRPRLIDPRPWDRGPAVGGLAPPGGETVWLETFGVFVAGFLALKGVSYAVHAAAPPDSPLPIIVPLALQWVLMLTLLWPVVRGVSWQEYRRRMGYHAAKGVGYEVGCGVVAYITALPLLALAAIVSAGLMIGWRKIVGDEHAPMPDNKLIDMVGGPTWLVVVLGLLAVLWAPIVEEGIFRGALYRHLRRTMPALASALVVGLFFAVMHGYIVFQLIVIATLGTVFAIMREWRGSIIPSMTAHALHNTLVLILLTTLVTLASD